MGILDRLAHHVRGLLPVVVIPAPWSASAMACDAACSSLGTQLLHNAVHGRCQRDGLLLRHGHVDFTSVAKQLEPMFLRLP